MLLLLKSSAIAVQPSAVYFLVKLRTDQERLNPFTRTGKESCECVRADVRSLDRALIRDP